MLHGCLAQVRTGEAWVAPTRAGVVLKAIIALATQHTARSSRREDPVSFEALLAVDNEVVRSSMWNLLLEDLRYRLPTQRAPQQAVRAIEARLNFMGCDDDFEEESEWETDSETSGA